MPSPESPAPRRHTGAIDRLPAAAWIMLAVVAIGFGGWLGGALDGGGAEPDRSPAAEAARWRVPDAGARTSLAAYAVQDEAGQRVPLAPAGEPAVVMVSSESCSVCAETFDLLANEAGAGALPRLRVVTLEGAAAGARMLAQHGLSGVWHAGPADGAGRTLLTFQFPGTPTFLLLDEHGHVRAAMPGFPGRERFAPWVAVMRGVRDSL